MISRRYDFCSTQLSFNEDLVIGLSQFERDQTIFLEYSLNNSLSSNYWEYIYHGDRREISRQRLESVKKNQKRTDLSSAPMFLSGFVFSVFGQCFIGKHETARGRRNAGINHFGLKSSRDQVSPFPGWLPWSPDCNAEVSSFPGRLVLTTHDVFEHSCFMPSTVVLSRGSVLLDYVRERSVLLHTDRDME